MFWRGTSPQGPETLEAIHDNVDPAISEGS